MAYFVPRRYLRLLELRYTMSKCVSPIPQGALQNPADQNAQKTMDSIMRDMRGELQAAHQYDSIELTLPGSGMIEAATNSARGLQKAFDTS